MPPVKSSAGKKLPANSLRQVSGFWYRKSQNSVNGGTFDIPRPLSARMNWFRFATLMTLWGFMLFFCCSIFSGTYFLSSKTIIKQPSIPLPGLPEDFLSSEVPVEVMDQIQTYIDSKGYTLAIIMIVGFFVAPAITIAGIFVMVFVPMTDQFRYLLVRRADRIARASLGPIVLTFSQAMYGSFDIYTTKGINIPGHEQSFTLEAVMTNVFEIGLFYQAFNYVFAITCMKIIYSENKIDPPTRTTRSRRNTLILCQLFICLFLITPYYHVYVKGEFATLLRNAQRTYTFWTYDGFDKMRYLEGYQDYSFFYFYWVIFLYLLPLMSLTFQTLYQISPNSYTQWLEKNFRPFFIFEVLLGVFTMRSIGENAQARYFEENNLASFCAKVPDGKTCFDTDHKFVYGYYFLLTGVLFYYIPDVCLFFLGLYRSRTEQDRKEQRVTSSELGPSTMDSTLLSDHPQVGSGTDISRQPGTKKKVGWSVV